MEHRLFWRCVIGPLYYQPVLNEAFFAVWASCGLGIPLLHSACFSRVFFFVDGSWSTRQIAMKDFATCVRRLSLTYKQVETRCMGDNQSVPEEIKRKRELSPDCAQPGPKCLYFARIGRRDIFWTVNMLASSVTTWNAASQHVTKDCKDRSVTSGSLKTFVNAASSDE